MTRAATLVALLLLAGPARAQDADRDLVPDASDRCPDAAETLDGTDDEDGCPEAGAHAVLRVAPDELVLLEPILFELEHARIRAGSMHVLDVVAAVLRAHPELGPIRVEGHMDPSTAREREALSSRLWLDRPRAVIEALVARGVDRARLVADSLVTDRPVCDPAHVPAPRRRACRRQNDRVVLRRSR